jgi:hypothetical protein
MITVSVSIAVPISVSLVIALVVPVYFSGIVAILAIFVFDLRLNLRSRFLGSALSHIESSKNRKETFLEYFG